jgi:hypothetical protein
MSAFHRPLAWFCLRENAGKRKIPPMGGICVKRFEINGRDGQIRTADPSHPKRVLYQAEPRPDTIEPALPSRLLGLHSVYTSRALLCRPIERRLEVDFRVE